MPFKESRGDLLAVQRGIVVHGCNAQGVMGSGVAAAIRTRYPGAFQAYRKAFESNGLHLGEVIGFSAERDPSGRPSLVIANAITQEFYGREPGRVYVSYSAITQCFAKIAKKARELELEVHFPLIGCGLGGGDWREVSRRINEALADVPGTLWMPD